MYVVTKQIDRIFAGNELRYFLAPVIERVWHDVYRSIIETEANQYELDQLKWTLLNDVNDSIWSYKIVPYIIELQAPTRYLAEQLSMGLFDYPAAIKANKHLGKTGRDHVYQTVNDIGKIWQYAVSNCESETGFPYPPKKATVWNTNKWIKEVGIIAGVDILMETYFSGVPAEHIVA